MTSRVAPRTVVESLLPASGSIALPDVYRVSAMAGLEEQPVRLAIRRLILAGDLSQHGRGRSGFLEATPTGAARLSRDRERIDLAFAQDAGDVKWDGRWHLHAARVSGQSRPLQDRIVRNLVTIGGAPLSMGLVVCTRDLTSEVADDFRPYLASASSDDLSVHGVSEPRALAELLWPSEQILARYPTTADVIKHGEESSTASPERRALLLATSLLKAVRFDPLLPSTLLPSPWPPTEMRLAWRARWDDLRSRTTFDIYPDWLRERARA